MGIIQAHCCHDNEIKKSGIIINKEEAINYIIKIQSYFRGFNFRRKNITLTKKKEFFRNSKNINNKSNKRNINELHYRKSR